MFPPFQSTEQSHTKDERKRRLTCTPSCTKADLSTEGRGPVCRVPILTLSHFPLVISTTIPVAVWYGYTNTDTVDTRFITNPRIQFQQQCWRIIRYCRHSSTAKGYLGMATPQKGMNLKTVGEPLCNFGLGSVLTRASSSRTVLV